MRECSTIGVRQTETDANRSNAPTLRLVSVSYGQTGASVVRGILQPAFLTDRSNAAAAPLLLRYAAVVIRSTV